MLGNLKAAGLGSAPNPSTNKPKDGNDASDKAQKAAKSVEVQPQQPPRETRQAQPAQQSGETRSTAPSPPPPAEKQAPPPSASPVPAPSTAILAAAAPVPAVIEAQAPVPVSDALADKRAALAKITDTAQNWNKGGTVLDAAVDFAARTAEESRETPAAGPSTAPTRDETEARARSFAAEQGYGASKTVFEGGAPEGETSKAA